MRLLREDWMPELWAHPFLSLGQRSSESRAMSDSLTDCKGRCPNGTAEGWGLQTAPLLVGLQGQGLLHPLICFGPCPASQHSSPATSHLTQVTLSPCPAAQWCWWLVLTLWTLNEAQHHPGNDEKHRPKPTRATLWHCSQEQTLEQNDLLSKPSVRRWHWEVPRSAALR